MMNCIEIAEYGGPEVLRPGQRPRPTPAAGEVLIRVQASGVNRPDVMQRKGHYAPPPGASDVPGLEVAGWIESGDAAAMARHGFKPGDAVCALVAGGGYAEYCTAPIEQCLPIPKGLSLAQAAGLPETFFTVWSNVFERGRLQAGETLLIHGGTSGIGVTAIQLAKAFGAQVIVTAGSDDKCAAARQLGADAAINYRSQDFVQETLAFTNGRGADVILDMVAGDYVRRNVECMAEDGRALIIAVQGGTQAEFNAGLVLRKRLSISGATLRARSVAFKGAIAQTLRERVWPLLEQGSIRPVLQAEWPALDARGQWPSGAAAAHAEMEGGALIGKLVLTWPEATQN